MEAVIHLDTHVALWLRQGYQVRLREVRQALDRSVKVISPIVILELQYLFETGRINEPGEALVAALIEQIDLQVADTPFSQVVRRALQQTWTRDPFDRLIVGNALCENAALLTADETIHAHCRLARWR